MQSSDALIIDTETLPGKGVGGQFDFNNMIVLCIYNYDISLCISIYTAYLNTVPLSLLLF
uniref:Uncharacterized protein n=1 Tax=Rhizophora mucronata TaxID=61149 RepID=A0A2P2M882_RHIMU